MAQSAARIILFVKLPVGEKALRHDFKEGNTAATATFIVKDHNAPLAARKFRSIHGFRKTRYIVRHSADSVLRFSNLSAVPAHGN